MRKIRFGGEEGTAADAKQRRRRRIVHKLLLRVDLDLVGGGLRAILLQGVAPLFLRSAFTPLRGPYLQSYPSETYIYQLIPRNAQSSSLDLPPRSRNADPPP